MNQISREFWDKDRTEQLIDLSKTSLSAAEIAAQIGATRNAILGKLFRLGLSTCNEQNGKKKPRRKFWDDEKIATLRRLWASGYSARAIAAHLDAHSPYAVHSKAKKLKLPGRHPSRIICDGHIKRVRAPRVFVPLTDIPAPTDQFKCTLAELGNDTCRWPLWDDETQGAKFYCGMPEADCKEGRSYCRWHTALGTKQAL